MRVLIFGDSIAQGFWDTRGGWTERVRMRYWQQYFSEELQDPPTVFNLGVSSNDSADVLERFMNEVSARSDGQEIVIVIAVGINDARLKDGKQFSTPEQYRSNLEQIVSQAKNVTNRLLMVGCTACDESLTNPVAWGTTSYTNNRIWEFETELRDLCAAQNIPQVKLFETFRAAASLLDDGLHPNTQGHEVIFDAVVAELDQLIK